MWAHVGGCGPVSACEPVRACGPVWAGSPEVGCETRTHERGSLRKYTPVQGKTRGTHAVGLTFLLNVWMMEQFREVKEGSLMNPHVPVTQLP